MMSEIELFFTPKSIAVVGATENPTKFGYEVTKNIIHTIKDADNPPKLFMINPTRTEVFGHATYKTISEIKEDVDLVIILVPRKHVMGVVIDATEKKVPAIIIVTAGFAEHDEEGKRLQDEITRLAKATGSRVMGPNCVGIINMDVPLNASFIMTPKRGDVALISQSGSMAAALVYQGLTLRYFANIGNQADLTETELLTFFARHSDVRVIGLYLETVKEGRKFYEVLKSTEKPVVVLKTGRTIQGAKSAASHTGSITTSHTSFLAAIKQARKHAVTSEQEFIAALKVLSHYDPIRNMQIGIISNAGGPMVTLTDLLTEEGLSLAKITDTTKSMIRETLSPLVKPQNPLDIIAHSREEEYYQATKAMLLDPNINVLVVMCVVPTFLGMEAVEHARGTIRAIKEVNNGKPVILSWLSGEIAEPGLNLAQENGIVGFSSLPETLGALKALHARE